MVNMERWIDINGFGNKYRISSYGNVVNKLTGHKLTIQISKRGYGRIILSNGKVKKFVSVHRLVATHFIENKENKPCVNHKNGIKNDNRVENLEWVTYSENLQHKFRVLKYPQSNSVKIINTESGEIYNSITDAALKNNINRSTLTAMISGINPNTSKFVKL